jgi:hypothetical protein
MSEDPKSVSDRPVALKQLAIELGRHEAAIKKAVVRRGFVPFNLSEGKNKPLYLKQEDAELFRKCINDEQDNLVMYGVAISQARISGVYFIEVPSYVGINRVKIGWSDNIPDRLSSYRTIIPDLRVKAVWPTADAWCERAALKCADRIGKRVHQELFEFENVDVALDELSELFSKMGMVTSVKVV